MLKNSQVSQVYGDGYIIETQKHRIILVWKDL